MKVEVISCQSLGMVKCPRCWHYHNNKYNFGHEIGAKKYNEEFLCDDCTRTILTDFKEHKSVPFILENLKNRGITVEQFINGE
jgi:hypothetical protein